MPMISTSSGRIELPQHLFAVGHLRYGLGRDKGNGVQMLEAGADQRPQILNLKLGGNAARQPLPGIARTFDEFEVGHIRVRYVCITPTLNFATSGLWEAASSAAISASRVSTGSMIASTHRRAAP